MQASWMQQATPLANFGKKENIVSGTAWIEQNLGD